MHIISKKQFIFKITFKFQYSHIRQNIFSSKARIIFFLQHLHSHQSAIQIPIESKTKSLERITKYHYRQISKAHNLIQKNKLKKQKTENLSTHCFSEGSCHIRDESHWFIKGVPDQATSILVELKDFQQAFEYLIENILM